MAGSMLSKLWVELGFKDGGFQKGTKAAAQSLSKLNAAGNQMSSIFGGVANKAVTGLVGSLTAFTAASAVVGAKFDREMKFVGAIAGATGDEIQALEDRARDLGKTTMFSATEAANAMQSFARVGLETNEIIAATGPALLLAGAAGHDLTSTTQMMAATMAQFNLQATEAGRISDVFGEAITNSLFDMTSLTEAMKYGGTVGNAFNYTLEETTAALALFRNMGLEGSLAGTNFRMAMAHAAKVTDQGQKVLDRLGLTAADISPEFNKFADIMENLAGTTITTSEALILFGRRSGTNVKGIIDSFRTGETAFYDLLDGMENATGATERLYEKATDNVLDQFTIVKSAFQELMLTVFDAYKGPLTELLKAVSEVLQFTATGVTESGKAMTDSFTQGIDMLTAYFLSEKENIASAFRELMTMFAGLLKLIMNLAPYLSTVAKTLAIMWAVGKVVAFTNAVVQLQLMLITLKAQALAAGSSLAVAFAPVAGIVVAAAALGAGLFYIAKGNDAAAQRTKDFAAGMREAKAEMAALRNEEAVYVSKTAELSTGWAAQVRMAKWKNGELDKIYDRELAKLEELDEAQAKDMIARGQLVAVMQDGQEVYKTTRLLVHEYLQELEGGVEAGDALTAAEERLKAEIAATKEEIVALNEVLQEFKEAEKDATGASDAHHLALKREYGSAGKVKAQIHLLSPALGSLEKQYNGLKRAVESATNANERYNLTQQGVVKNTVKTAKEIEAAQKKYASALKSATEARKRLQEDARDDAFKALNSEFEYRQRLQQKDLQEAKEVYGKELALRKGNADAVKELEEQLAQTLLDIEARHAEASIQSQRDLLEKLASDREGFREGEADAEMDAIKDKYAQLRSEETKRTQETLKLAKDNNEVIQTTETQHQAVMKQIADTEAEAISNLQTKRAKETCDQIRQIRVDNESETARTIEGVEAELQDALAKAQYANEEQRNQIIKLFAERRQRVIQQTELKILDILNGFSNKRILLQKERDLLLASLTEETEKYRAAIILRYQELINAARREEKEELKSNLEAQGDFIDRYWDRALAKAQVTAIELKEAGKAAGEALAPAAEVAQEEMEKLGKALIRDATEVGEEVADRLFGKGKLQKAIEGLKRGFAVVGDWIKDKVGKGIDAAADRTKPLGKGFHAAGIAAKGIGLYLKATKSVFNMMLAGVGKFAKGAVAAGKMVAAGVGKITAAWNKSLDALSNYLGFSFSITDGMSAANDMMDDRAQKEQELADIQRQMNEAMASGDMDAYNDLVREKNELQSAIDALPETHKQAAEQYATNLVSGAVETLDKLVTGAPAMIAALAEALPELFTSLAQQLPTLFQGLAEAVPLLIDAIIVGVPKIINALVEGLPILFESIIAKLPEIVTMLMQALTALIGLVGDLVAQFILALPEIMTAFFEQLPFLIEALIDSLDTIIIALVEAIPLIIEGFIANIGPLLQKLIEGALQLITTLLQELPKLITALVKQIPVLVNNVLAQLPYMISAVIGALPEIIEALVSMIPDIIVAVIEMIPQLITSIITNIPLIIEVLVRNIPYIAYVLVTEVIGGMIAQIGRVAWEFIQAIWQFFADVIREIFSLGAKKTKTFGDTPGVQHTRKGEEVRFAAGDYYAAAKTPLDLLAQALNAINPNAMASQMAAGIGTAQLAMAGNIAPPVVSGASVTLPDMQPLVGGLMQMVDSLGASGGSLGDAPQDIRVTVTAEGSTLDDVLYRATKRGHAPKLVDMMKKVSGVDVGMWRGGFADES